MSDLMTTEEVAEYIHYSPRTVRKMRNEGGGPVFIATGKRLYRRADVDAWLDAKRRAHTAADRPPEEQR